MKKVLLLLIIGAGFYAYNKYSRKAVEVTQPVYSEFRMQMSKPHGGRSVEGLLLTKFASEAECQTANSISRKVIGDLSNSQNAQCQDCSVTTTTTCSTELPARYESLFDNAPTHLSYLSWSYTAPAPMEVRLIFWNVNPVEARQVCDATQTVADIGLKKKATKSHFFASDAVVGTVRCVHPVT